MASEAMGSADLSGGISPEREFMYPACPVEPDIRDAVNVWLETRDGRIGMRIGVELVSTDWDHPQVWLDVAFADGRVLSLREFYPRHSPLGADGRPRVLGAGPVRFECVEPFRRWTAVFDGQARDTTAAALIDAPLPDRLPMVPVSFSIAMDMAVPPWSPGSLLADAAEALKGEQGDFMSPRYEQLFRATGTLRVGDEDIALDAHGLRIRRQGFRKFEGFWGHAWQSALFPSGKAFGCNIYPPRDDGVANFNEAFVFDGTGAPRAARVVEAPWLTRLVPAGDDVTVVLETGDGQRVRIEGTTFVNTRSVGGSHALPQNFPIVQQAHARYRWDGEDTVGMVERSSTPDKFVE